MTTMKTKDRSVPKTLEDYLTLPYRLEITQGEYGSFVVRYPDLPGCVTQVDKREDVLPTAHEILSGWLEIALEDGQEIPLPRRADTYSGKFIVRISKSLHRTLAETAEAEGVSLNAFVAQLLAAGQAHNELHHRLDDLCEKVDALRDELPVSFIGMPQPRSKSASTGAALPLAA